MNLQPTLALLAFLACERQEAQPAPTLVPSARPGSASSVPTVAIVPEVKSAEGAATATATAPGGAAPSTQATPTPPEPKRPAARVKNIGLHIGGGPNDAKTKAPIIDSIAPSMDTFAACFSRAESQDKGGDFGIDLLVPAGGGIAKVSNPRTSLRGTAFRDCVVHTFEGISFAKPLGGATMASYSLAFSLEK